MSLLETIRQKGQYERGKLYALLRLFPNIKWWKNAPSGGCNGPWLIYLKYLGLALSGGDDTGIPLS